MQINVNMCECCNYKYLDNVNFDTDVRKGEKYW